MPQCEMCGKEVPSLKSVRIEGAEIDVCDECSDFGTEVRTESTSQSTKYSTGSTGGSADASSTTGTSSSGSGGSGGSGSRRHDMFDEMEEIAQDYDERIRNARESAGLSQEELADQLNEKASLIRKLEHGDSLPSDSIQTKLERKLGITLSESTETEDSEWEGGSSTGSYTLGDVVRRKK